MINIVLNQQILEAGPASMVQTDATVGDERQSTVEKNGHWN